MDFHIRYHNLHDIRNWFEQKVQFWKKICLLSLKGFLCMGVKRTPIFWAEGYEDTSNFVTYPRKYNWRGNIWSLLTEEFNRYTCKCKLLNLKHSTKRILLNLLYSIISKGTCQRFNGGCEGICVPQQEGCRCECDVGLQLQNDSRTCNSSKSTFTFWKIRPKVKCGTQTLIIHLFSHYNIKNT